MKYRINNKNGTDIHHDFDWDDIKIFHKDSNNIIISKK